MKELTRWAMMALVSISLAGCVSGSQSSDGDAYTADADLFDNEAVVEDEFAEFEDDAAPAEQAVTGNAEEAPASDEVASSELDEFDDSDFSEEQPAEQVASAEEDLGDDFSLDEPAEQEATAQQEVEPLPAELATSDLASNEEIEIPEVEIPSEFEDSIAEAPAPEPTPTPTPAPSYSSSSSDVSTITAVRYKANDAGGTLLIEANGPISYTTRNNPELGQLIVEVPNTILPKRLQRPLNTRDIQGTIGAIDPYQNAGSNVSRFVIQLRPESPEPLIQQEGNTIMVVANTSPDDHQAAMVRGDSTGTAEFSSGQILASTTLDDFLANNTKFYGRKISIEMDRMDIVDAFRFLTEESGVNMVVAEEVKGSISLKLRQVPWDQALVVIMKAKGLGYTRQGNVLRIAPLEQLRKEEEEANRVAIARRTVEALQVRVYPISYAQAKEMAEKVTSFLSERGKVTADVRTNSLVVTDIEENLNRVAQLVKSLDTQPPQVLIEGKIVEATESFLRTVGINWRLGGEAINMGATGPSGPVTLRPTLGINPMSSAAGSALNFNLNLGVMDTLGSLGATLALHERDEKVRILSSPRIVTMTNEPAKMSQTNEVPVRQVTVNGNTTQETFTFKPLTLMLDVTPQITADSSVIMKVNVKREFQGAREASGEFAVNSREAVTRVLVQNGQTAVIGGIYQSDAVEGEVGVPVLKDIPLLGYLFKSRSTDRRKTELLVFLTPRILNPGNMGDAGAPPSGEM